jgi:hypothetical protein
VERFIPAENLIITNVMLYLTSFADAGIGVMWSSVVWVCRCSLGEYATVKLIVSSKRYEETSQLAKRMFIGVSN